MVIDHKWKNPYYGAFFGGYLVFTSDDFAELCKEIYRRCDYSMNRLVDEEWKVYDLSDSTYLEFDFSLESVLDALTN